jgi:hypothetical protein
MLIFSCGRNQLLGATNEKVYQTVRARDCSSNRLSLYLQPDLLGNGAGMNELSLNDVISIQIEDIRDRTDRVWPFAVRDIVIETTKGNFTISLYANDLKNLEVKL